jgi:Tol biopolymer transport system component
LAPPTPSGPTPSQAEFADLRLAWSPRGDRLAAVASDRGAAAEPTLWLVDRDGRVERRVTLGPNGLTDAPEWTPDGQWLIVNTFPAGGRRVVAVEVAGGRVVDLSQPRWDAFAALAPDGRNVLLWNGRGGFWLAPLERA